MATSLRFSRPVSILLFLLAVLVIVVIPATCAIDRAYDEDSPPETGVEGIPDALD